MTSHAVYIIASDEVSKNIIIICISAYVDDYIVKTFDVVFIK